MEAIGLSETSVNFYHST